jgi:ABC-type transporter Mla subunit MlaD
VPALPSPGRLVRLLREQAEAVVALPGALVSLTRAVSSLDGTIREARDTVGRLQRLGERLEGILDEVEEPVKDLAPGLRRVGRVLDDPAVSEIPETVRRIRQDVLPLVATLRGGADVLDRFSARALLGGGRRRPEVAIPPTPPVIPPTPPAIPPTPPAVLPPEDPPAESGG